MASLKNVKICFEAVSTANIDDLINHIKILLKRNKDQETPPKCYSFIETGDKFLSFVDEQKEKFGETVDLLKSGEQVSDVISGILEQVGKAYWTVAGLSMIGYLLTKVGQTSDTQTECLKLLHYMLDLADHIHRLERQDLQAKEKPKNALVIIVKGSMLCAKQLSSNRLFRFMESSLDSKNLSSLLSEIKILYPDLQLTAVPATLQQQPKRLPVSKPDYPAQAGSRLATSSTRLLGSKLAAKSSRTKLGSKTPVAQIGKRPNNQLPTTLSSKLSNSRPTTLVSKRETITNGREQHRIPPPVLNTRARSSIPPAIVSNRSPTASRSTLCSKLVSTRNGSLTASRSTLGNKPSSTATTRSSKPPYGRPTTLLTSKPTVALSNIPLYRRPVPAVNTVAKSRIRPAVSRRTLGSKPQHL